jgi:hypothetical protein
VSTVIGLASGSGRTNVAPSTSAVVRAMRVLSATSCVVLGMLWYEYTVGSGSVQAESGNVHVLGSAPMHTRVPRQQWSPAPMTRHVDSRLRMAGCTSEAMPRSIGRRSAPVIGGARTEPRQTNGHGAITISAERNTANDCVPEPVFAFQSLIPHIIERDTRNPPKIKHISPKQKLAVLFRSQSSRW